MPLTPGHGLPTHWNGLLRGEWSLLDIETCSGRRRVLEMRNGDEDRTLRALSATERKIAGAIARGVATKVVASDLGLSVPTVSNHLRRAMAKIGARNRVILARVYVAQGRSISRRVVVRGDLRVVEDRTPLARRLERLTDAERTVALLVLEGLSNREIARSREVSEHTIRGQLEDIYRLYGVGDRVALVHALEGPDEPGPSRGRRRG